MPLWLKITLSVLTAFVILISVVILLAFWMINVPKLDLERDDPSAAEDLETWFENLHEAKLPKFNGVVLIRRGDDILLNKGFGKDSLGRQLTADSPIRLASVSKQFTVVGVLTLVRDERIDLDTPLSTYMPECEFPSATPRTLLNHTSGIPDVTYSRANGDKLLTLEGVVELICDGTLESAETPEFEYSNTGYLLAAHLIERVSGQSFEDYMREAVFDPLGMENSRVWTLVSTRPFPERAGGFNGAKRNKPALEPGNLDGVAGDGGVFSTLNDLENWDRFWSDDRLISPALKTLALTAGEGDYGFGWVRDGDIAWHNGAWLGSNTLIRRNLRTGDLTILLDNSNNLAFDGIAAKLRDFLGK